MGLAPEPAGDLSPEALAEAFGGRPLRSYPALLSTDADARAWARSGAPAGALVVADYQAAPRGRAGLPWEVRPGEGLGFSLILRPRLSAEEEGWPYIAVTTGLADVAGPAARISWPDEVRLSGDRWASAGVHVELGPHGAQWAVATVLVRGVQPPRTALLTRLVERIGARCDEASDTVLGDYRARCATIGHEVRARLIPMGPAGAQVSGRAVDCLADGALVLETAKGNRVAVRPQHLGMLDDL